MERDAATALDARAGLPEGLGALLSRHPREGWRAHPEFGPLTTFWMERHVMFRRMLDALGADARAAQDGTMDPAEHARRLSRVGGAFLDGLHGHHSIEDDHYFPRLIALAPSLERGFAILDADHHRLHEELDGFAQAANAVLRGLAPGAGDGRDAVGRLGRDLDRLQGFLDRHLLDEEDLVVPILLEMGESRVG